MTKLVGVFGGTFDPVHFGHLKPALALLKELSFSEIRVIPAGQPPHRSPPVATASQRWHMLTTVLASMPGLVADDCELRRDGPSFAVDTLEAIRERLRGQEANLCLIVGSDAFAGLDTWHRWEDLVGMCNVVVMQRPGSTLPAQGAVADLLDSHRLSGPSALREQSCGGVLPWPVPQLDISSTAIRACVAAGQRPRYLLPGSVWAYICRVGIYGARAVSDCS